MRVSLTPNAADVPHMPPDALRTANALNVLNIWLAVAGILLSGGILAILLLGLRSFGQYTERIERSNTATRQSNELVRQEIGRWNDRNNETVTQNDEMLRALDQMRKDLITFAKERSA